MEIANYILLFAAGIISGSLNSVVGGGSFISFPLLVFLGVPPISANATSTISLWPGTLTSLFGYRRELISHHKLLPLFIPLAFLGGLIGALIIINMSNNNFASIVPYLLLFATTLFTFKDRIIKWIRIAHISHNQHSKIYWILVSALALVISIYGGFFGAGLGIIFLAFFSIIGMKNIHEINAIRTCLGASINGIAVVIFIFAGKITWLAMLPMALGAIVGGHYCTNYIRKISPDLTRKFIVIIAWIMTFCFFYKQFSF